MGERSYADGLRLTHRLTGGALQQAVQCLNPAPGSRGLDAGCGIGQHTLWLAEAVGPQGRVIGLDLSPEHAVLACDLARVAGRAPGTSFVVGDVASPPFGAEAFDWVWCADTLWPKMVTEDPAAALRGLRGLVRPGGWIALAYWSGQGLLPGHPGLEARLHRTFVDTTPYLRETRPERQHMRALGWFRASGIERVRARTFVADICGPLTHEKQQAAAFAVEMLWGGLEGRVSGGDWAELRRLTSERSADFLFARTDYYGYILYTCFCGQVPPTSRSASCGPQTEVTQ